MKQRLIASALFALFATQAQAAKLYISEYANVGTAVYAEGGQSGVLEVSAEPSLQQTPVDFSGGAASSAPFGSHTRFVRIICDAQCSVKFGAVGQSAPTNANMPLGAMTPEYFGVAAGQIISVISNP